MSNEYDRFLHFCLYVKELKLHIPSNQRIKRTEQGDPELSPVYHLHKIFSSKEEQDDVAEGCRTAGIGCIDCKKVLIKNLFTVLEPLWEKRSHYLERPDELEDIIAAGSNKARGAAMDTMLQVRNAMGLDGLM